MIEYNRFKSHLKRTDKNILKLFIGVFFFFIFLTIIMNIFQRTSIEDSFSSFMASLIFNFMAVGFLAFKYQGKRGVISTGAILKLFAMISVAGSLFILAFVVIVPWLRYFGFTDLNSLNFEMSGIFINDLGIVMGVFCVLIFVFFIVIFLILILFLATGFGMAGILSALQKGLTPEILMRISKITHNTSDKMKEKDWKIYWKYRLLKWLFNVHDVLDTNSLKLKKAKPIKQFPWRILWNAFLFQFLFSSLIIIYISLNPFLLEARSFDVLFNVSTSITFLIPFLVLPWFIYLRLDAKIKGIHKDFKLYDGLKSRVLGTLVALGTLIFILRLALKDLDLMEFLGSFAIFYFFFIIITVIITFVYFNYYENDLAKDITVRYKKLRGSSIKNRNN